MVKVDCTTIAALLMAFTVPVEVWAGVELSQGHLEIALPLIAVAGALNFFGIRTWIGAQSKDIEDELEDKFAKNN